MNKVIAILFALVSFCCAALSRHLLGAGMWFWIMISVAAFVALSQFIPALVGIGAGLALLLAGISLLAVALGLLAATTGGGFNIDDSSLLLLCSFFIIALLGTTLALIYKNSQRRE